ncbi:hypothetical protein C5612_04465 [Pseudomonas frederiksbergensis]|uniref:Uncharacterized protein n=1 Tax=Pseudomonas frederiksbergensis TaxID=104087 RepID=A0A2S8HU28_9PSED|nr:hypothetical protein C5612_04465 [Pseudomonas frederiksbergensis]
MGAGLAAKNDNAFYLTHHGVTIAGKPRSHRIGLQKGRFMRLFLWAPFGLSSGSPVPPLEPGVAQGITDDHQ